MLQTVLAWRNLDLMGEKKGSFQKVIYSLIVIGFFSILLFLLQKPFLPENSFYWIRSPQVDSSLIPIWLHVVGCIGIIAFSARFWIQWLDAERARESVLSIPFWWTSLLGAIISGGYFLILLDWVNAIGPLCAIVPYTRNLFLNGKNK
jgi:lipid-A-disaccharide synthase